MAEIDVVELAARAMELRGYAVTRHDTWVEHRDSGFAVRPHLLESHPADTFVRSVVAVTTSHQRLAPEGVVEYQHAVGDTLSEAVSSGIDQWLQLDFVVFLDALRDQAKQCGALEFAFPGGTRPAVTRRAMLGPVGHIMAQPERAAPDAEHPFCPCCFLTNSYEAFRPLIEGEGFYGIRLFAARNDDGSPQADCRVNGQDWESGKQALLDYVASWPQAGFELRKQYVILQTLSGSGGP
jgi:hypothetical protein